MRQVQFTELNDEEEVNLPTINLAHGNLDDSGHHQHSDPLVQAQTGSIFDNTPLQPIIHFFVDIHARATLFVEDKNNLALIVRVLQLLSFVLLTTGLIIVLVQPTAKQPKYLQDSSLLVPTASPTSPPGVVIPLPQGIIQDFPFADIYRTQGCWQVCYRAPFNEITPGVTQLSSACNGDMVFVGAHHRAGSSTSDHHHADTSETSGRIVVGAFGSKSTVLAVIQQPNQESAKGISNNGVYWYGTGAFGGVARSIGFSSESSLTYTTAYDWLYSGLGPSCDTTLSFTVSTEGQINHYSDPITGAAGCRLYFKSYEALGAEYEKVIMYNTCPVTAK